MSKMSIMSNLRALGEAIKADNKKTLKPCVLEYKINFRIELSELLKYLNDYYKSVQSINFKIPDMSNIKTNTGALTKLGVALLRMPKYMEISQTTLINSVLSYTIDKKGTREQKQKQEQEQEQEHEQQKKDKVISNNVFAVLEEDDDIEKESENTNISEIKASEPKTTTLTVPTAPNAPRKQYGAVFSTPIIHTPIKLDLNDEFPSIGAPVKVKNVANTFTKDSATPVKLNFAEALSKAPSDEDVAKINRQKRLDAEVAKLENQDKLNMLDEIIDFSDISEDSDVCEKETPKKEKKPISWADSDSDDDF